MPPRFFVDTPLTLQSDLDLPPSAARHVQVLRLQPGSPITLFDGSGHEYQAEVQQMGRSQVRVHVQSRQLVQRELAQAVTLAVVMPANDRMDSLVEKATELGVYAIQPLMSERSVLRLVGERADKKVVHWQGVAVAACEQSGRTQVPVLHPVQSLSSYLAALPPAASDVRRCLLSPLATRSLRDLPWSDRGESVILSGPEGGLSPQEEQAAIAQGFVAVKLGPRILRADTAPLSVLGWLATQWG